MTLALVVVLASGLHTWSLGAQSSPAAQAPRMPAGFALAADALLAKSYPPNAPGAVAIVVKDGRPVLRRAYGLADLEFGILLDPDMVFRIGSVTKQFTAAAILQLVDQGKLALDDDVTKYVDRYSTGVHRVTVEHLLTHTSGVPSYTEMHEWFPHMREELTPHQILDMVKARPLSFEPGTALRVQQLRLSPAGARDREGVGPHVCGLHPADGAPARHATDDVRRSAACDAAARARIRAVRR